MCNIPDKKRSKLDYQKVWQGILIGYSSNTTKNFCIWAPQTRQMIIVSKPYVNKSERGVKLLEKWLLEVVPLSKRKTLAREPKPRGKPKKQVVVKGTAVPESRGKVKEVAMSMIESSSKIIKLTSFDEAINNSIHGRRWQEAIEHKLQNLENH